MCYRKSNIFWTANPENDAKIWKNDKNCENIPNRVKNSWLTENRIFSGQWTLKIMPKFGKMSNCENLPNRVENSWFTENRRLFGQWSLKIVPKFGKVTKIAKMC